VARALIVGCGCRGCDLGTALRERGWQVRGTSRTDTGAARIEAAGLEAAVADPDRGGTVVEQVGDVAVLVWLLDSARGGPTELAALHGPRFERIVHKLVDTPVRGLVVETAGSVPAELLAGAREIAAGAERTWRLPVRALDADRGRPGWSAVAVAAVEAALSG
jgi:hypothetical protein